MNTDPERIVITGLGVVSGYGQGVEFLEKGLLEDRSAIRELSWLDPALPCKIGSAAPQTIVCPPSAVEVRTRSAGMALAAAAEAWKQAGGRLETDNPSLRIHASIGWGPYDFEELYHSEKNDRKMGDHYHARTQCGHGEDVLQTVFRPGLGVSSCLSACAASTQAIGRAFYDLKAGRASICLAGGADSRLHVPGIVGYSKLGALATGFEKAPGEACRPFDAKRSGFVIGEGGGFLVMETLAHAHERGVPALAEILSASTNTDAFRLTDPRPDGTVAAQCIRECLRRAGLSAGELDYIQAHGTGTPANDRAEVVSLGLALGDEAKRIPVSSLKPYLGHLSMAAGVVELAACVLVLKHQFLPPCLNLENPEEGFQLHFVKEQNSSREVRTILKNSFGFGGQNACLLVRGRPEE